MRKIIKKLECDLKSKFYFDYDTSKNVWFRAGGKADFFCIVYDEDELKIILNSIVGHNYEIIGAGSNILVRDSGFKGILLKLGKNFNKIIIHKTHIEVGAGILDVNLAKFAQLNNISNFEFYSGIPGTIGGAIKMNAGCFGSETKDFLKNIKFINMNGKLIVMDNKKINFLYRKSNIPVGSIIISANYNYAYGQKEEIKNKMNKIKDMREKSQPLKVKTSGSTFKNPPNNFAAKLIEQSGCKGLNIGDIFVSNKHANFLINNHNGTATEIEDLGNQIIEKVYKKFQVKLEWEVKIIGN